MRKIILAVLACLIAFPAFAQEPLKPGDLISGRLRFFRHQHPNGSPALTGSDPNGFCSAGLIKRGIACRSEVSTS
jgi:hypothetical protein